MNDKKHQFGKKSGNRHAQVTPAIPLSPEMELRRRAVMRLDILPPYQSVMPQEMVVTTEDGREHIKVFRGLTKREHMAALFVAAAIQRDGLALQDVQMAHYARLALMQSEAVLQTISGQRGKDVEEVMGQLTREYEAMKSAAPVGEEPPKPEGTA